MPFLPTTFIDFIIYSGCIGSTQDMTGKVYRRNAIFNYNNPHSGSEQTPKSTEASQKLLQVTRRNSSSQVQE